MLMAMDMMVEPMAPRILSWQTDIILLQKVLSYGPSTRNYPAELETHLLAGDHINMVNQPHVQTLAREVSACLAKAFVGLRRKDPRKDAASKGIAPILDFVLRRPTPSRAPSISRFEKLSLAVLRLDNKSLRCVVVFNPGHSPSRRSEHCAFGSFVAAIWACRKERRCRPCRRVYVFIATSVRFLAFNFRITLRTWTFTVLKPMFSSLAIILLDLPCWIARTTESSRLVSI